MGKLITEDYINKTYERLTIKEIIYKKQDNYTEAFFICECKCGNIKTIRAANVKNGHTLSCGCLQKERTSKARKTHGGTHKGDPTRLYILWCGMKQRCYDTNRERYADYGGRGIVVCEEWRNSFEKFREWALANGYDENASRGECTIERKDNDGNYEVSNCCFANAITQGQNRRIRSDNSSGYKGVMYRHKKWLARISVNKERIHLGYFDTAEIAAKAYNEAAIKHFGKSAKLNEI